MKPTENKSLNSFITSFLREDASATIAPQGKATPKAGSVDAEEVDGVNDVIAKAIEAGKMFEDDAEDDKENLKVEDSEEDKEAVKEAEEDDKEVKSESEEEDK